MQLIEKYKESNPINPDSRVSDLPLLYNAYNAYYIQQNDDK